MADSMQAHRLEIFKPQNVRPAFLSRAIIHLTVRPRQGLLGPSPTKTPHTCKLHRRPTHTVKVPASKISADCMHVHRLAISTAETSGRHSLAAPYHARGFSDHPRR